MKNNIKKPENIDFYKECESRIKKIFLNKLPDYVHVYLFGSRTKQIFSYNSDIDLFITGAGDKEKEIINDISEEISDSDIPFKIDIVYEDNTNLDFKKKVLKGAIKWK